MRGWKDAGLRTQRHICGLDRVLGLGFWQGPLTALVELDLLQQQRVVGVLHQAAGEGPPAAALHKQQLRALRMHACRPHPSAGASRMQGFLDSQVAERPANNPILRLTEPCIPSLEAKQPCRLHKLAEPARTPDTGQVPFHLAHSPAAA